MQKVKITAVRKTEYKDLQAVYENPIEHACDIKEERNFVIFEFAKILYSIFRV